MIPKAVDLTGGSVQNLYRMARKQPSQKVELPTPGELRLLQVLWRIREGSIEDIVLASGKNPPPNYKTVQAWLRIMERKGQVDHRQEGRAFIFYPLINSSDLHRISVRHLLARHFAVSRSELLVALLNDERISSEELRKLEGLIRNRRKELS